MTLTLETLPIVSPDDLRRRSRPKALGRRAFVSRAAATVGALGIAYMTLWDTKRAGAADDGKYYKEFTSATTGPCGGKCLGTGTEDDPFRPSRREHYAVCHNELGKKCGPSFAHSRYCWTGADTVSGEALANTGNKRGWHKWGSVSRNRYYVQRPDDCRSSSSGSDYDSWRWTFKDGVTYGCSDGLVCEQFSCYLKTICPYPR